MKPLFLSRMSRWAVGALFFCAWGAWNATAAGTIAMRVDRTASQVIFTWGEQPLMVYAYGTNLFKPHVKSLHTLDGRNVLRDAPADHLHHHGLMYAVTVNGINFWEENTPTAGFQRHILLRNFVTNNSPNALPTAGFSEIICWLAAPDRFAAKPNEPALLIENRTLRVIVDETNREVAVAWRSAFTVGPSVPKVTLSGTDYHGLGLRFPASLDKAGLHENSDNAPYLTKGKRDVFAAQWNALSGAVDAKTAQITVFAQPANRPPSKFFTMLDPFAYISATQGLDKQPLEYPGGASFRLEYLVTVTPERRTPEALQARLKQWTASAP